MHYVMRYAAMKNDLRKILSIAESVTLFTVGGETRFEFPLWQIERKYANNPERDTIVAMVHAMVSQVNLLRSISSLASSYPG